MIDGQSACEALARLALDAGMEIMRIYRRGTTVQHKADQSPVTDADRNAEKIILEGLAKLYPGVPVVAEESCSAGFAPPDTSGMFFLVDPLDGTREFINNRSDFTVNIALVRRGVPIIGVVYAPAHGEFYCGHGHTAQFRKVNEKGEVVSSSDIAVRKCAAVPKIVASRSHRTPETDDFIKKYENAELVSVGSSLKFCILAAGRADIYPRFGRTMEWDTAAGDAVLRAAGGQTVSPDGKPLEYGKRNQPDDVDFANSHFIAFGGK
jgi:3'(2'), 5'-bisphosphate nucleotidase